MRALRIPTETERGRERALIYTNIADGGITVLLVVVAVASGSLTIMAEAVRACLLMTIDVFAIWSLIALHRGRLARYEFGPGKLEQLVWLLAGTGLILGAMWVASSVLAAVFSAEPPASPLGLAVAAVVNGINTLINAAGLYAMYQASGGKRTGVYAVQVRMRETALAVTLVLQISLTVAALSKDPGLALLLDALGAVIIIVIKVRRGARAIGETLPDLLDSPAEDPLRGRVRAAAARVIPDKALASVLTRRSGGTTFVRVMVRPEEMPATTNLSASAEAILQAMGDTEGVAVDLLVGIAPPREPA